MHVYGSRVEAKKIGGRDSIREQLMCARRRTLLTLRMHEGLIQISAKQRIRQIAEIFLQEGGYVVGTLVGAYLGLPTAIKVFS